MKRAILFRLLFLAACFAAAMTAAAMIHHSSRHAPVAQRVTVAPPVPDQAVAALAASPQPTLAPDAVNRAVNLASAQASSAPAIEVPAGAPVGAAASAGAGGDNRAGNNPTDNAANNDGAAHDNAADNGGVANNAATNNAATNNAATTAGPVASASGLLALSRWQQPDPLVIRQLDVCAGTHPPAGCPDGLPATIGRGGIVFRILDVQVDVSPYQRDVYDECLRDNVVPTDTDGVLAVLTSSPARITLSGAAQSSFATSDRARQYQARDPVARSVVTCARLPRTTRGDVTIVARPLAGDVQEDTQTVSVSFRTPTNRGRPPVTVQPVGTADLQLWVPLRPRERAVVFAYQLAPGVGTGPSCGSRPTSQRPADVTGTSNGVVPVAYPAGGGYSYDPAWSLVENATVALGGQGEYELCVQWTDQDASFDSYRVVDAEARIVGPPVTQFASVGVQGIVSGVGALPPGFDARQVRLNLTSVGMTPRGCDVSYSSLAGLPAPGQLSARPVPVCAAIRTAGYGQFLYVWATYGGASHETVIPLAQRACTAGGAVVPGCYGMHENRAVPLPVGAGGYAAMVVLRVDYAVPPTVTDPSRADWLVGAAQTVGADAGADTPPPLTGPRFDSLTTQARMLNGVPVLIWHTNEFVHLDVRATADTSTCDRPQQTVTVPAYATQGQVSLTGLCYGTAYQLSVTGTDNVGRTATVDSAAGYRLGLRTDPAHVRYHVTVMPRAAAVPAGSALRVETVNAWVGGALAYSDSVDPFDPGFLGAFPGQTPFDNLRCASFSGGPHPRDRTLRDNGTAFNLQGDWSSLVTLQVTYNAFVNPGNCGTHIDGSIDGHIGELVHPPGLGVPTTFVLPSSGYVQVVDPSGYWIVQIYLDR